MVTPAVAPGGGGEMPRASGDTLAPSATPDIAVDDRTATSLSVSWGGASDTGGSGLDRYAVTVDGRVVQTVDAPTTSATLTGLSADTSYDIGVTAFDGANNESYTLVRTATTAAESSDGDETGSGGSGSGGADGEPGDTDSGSEDGGSWWESGSSGDSGSDTGGGWWGADSGSDSGGDGGWLGSGGSDTDGDGGWW